MTLFGLVRHGQTDYNLRNLYQGASDIPLNATGREQAHRALDHLPDIHWDVVVASPLLRAQETAQIIAADHHITDGGTDEDLREIDWGSAEGHDVEQMRLAHPDRDFPGREETQVVADRGCAALARLAERYGDANVLVVAHGTLIRLLLSGIVGRALGSIDNATLSLVRVDGPVWTVDMIGGVRAEPVTRTLDSAHPVLHLDPSWIHPAAAVWGAPPSPTAVPPTEETP